MLAGLRGRIVDSAVACSVNLRSRNLRRAQGAFGIIWASEWAATARPPPRVSLTRESRSARKRKPERPRRGGSPGQERDRRNVRQPHRDLQQRNVASPHWHRLRTCLLVGPRHRDAPGRRGLAAELDATLASRLAPGRFPRRHSSLGVIAGTRPARGRVASAARRRWTLWVLQHFRRGLRRGELATVRERGGPAR
jgi:hypothetical protein